jgi:hypothetical protein
MSSSIFLNDTNNTCSSSLLWYQSSVNNQKPALYVCIIAAIVHSVFWLQLVFCPSVRQKTMQWIYAYLATDIFLLFRFFFSFIIHTTSTECIPNRSWALFVCYFEAITDNYLNVLEVYILLALNLCRYAQIAWNKNVYATNVRLLTFTHLAIYLMPIIIFIVQLYVGWMQLDEFIGDSCDTGLTSIYAQIFNVVITYAFPIVLNILVIYASVRHIQSTSRLSATQHHATAREKYHRALVIQFLVFYTVWLLLWSPNVIVYQFTSSTNTATSVCSLLNYTEIALDPLIIAALDVRFFKVWKKMWMHLKNGHVGLCRIRQRKTYPTTIAITLHTVQQKRTTRF